MVEQYVKYLSLHPKTFLCQKEQPAGVKLYKQTIFKAMKKRTKEIYDLFHIPIIQNLFSWNNLIIIFLRFIFWNEQRKSKKWKSSKVGVFFLWITVISFSWSYPYQQIDPNNFNFRPAEEVPFQLSENQKTVLLSLAIICFILFFMFLFS